MNILLKVEANPAHLQSQCFIRGSWRIRNWTIILPKGRTDGRKETIKKERLSK